MKVGWLGLGRLGLPCALACEWRGHEVRGVDPDPRIAEILEQRRYPHREVGVKELLEDTQLKLVDVDELVGWADVIFVAVQTPHEARFEGVTPMPKDREDFDYMWLVEAVRSIATAAGRRYRRVTVAVVSTVLPGTIAREIAPLLNNCVQLVYTPQFIAMGTTVADFLHPEFWLLGTDRRLHDDVAAVLGEFFASINADAPIAVMSVASAELTKVAYNVFVGAKIVFANYLGELADATGADVDDVTDTLAMATRRVISPAYLRAGMGDGGGCHPRDLIALSWASKRYGLSYDLPRRLMRAREAQAWRLAEHALSAARDHGLPIAILGKAYKPETNLTVGSPAVLLHNLLASEDDVEVSVWDPYVDLSDEVRAVLDWRFQVPAVYVIATDHPGFRTATYQPGSVVIDPWGHTKVGEGVELITPGRRP